MQTSTKDFCVKFGRSCDCLVECTVAEDEYEREFLKKTKDKVVKRRKWGEKQVEERVDHKRRVQDARQLKERNKHGD